MMAISVTLSLDCEVAAAGGATVLGHLACSGDVAVVVIGNKVPAVVESVERGEGARVVLEVEGSAGVVVTVVGTTGVVEREPLVVEFLSGNGVVEVEVEVEVKVDVEAVVVVVVALLCFVLAAAVVVVGSSRN